MAGISAYGTTHPYPTASLLQPITPGEDDYKNGCDFKKAGNLPQAFLSYQSAAEKGHAEAQLKLAQCYKRGEGTGKNEKMAGEWYQKAAAQNHPTAQGCCFFFAYGVPKDDREAFNWFERGAGQGCAVAQHNLGRCYEDGIGMAKDETEAFKWYFKAAEQCDAAAQSNVGNCYYDGIGTPKNETEALKWYQKSG